MSHEKDGNEVRQRQQDYSHECQRNGFAHVLIGYQSSEIIRHASIPLIQSSPTLPE
jgi:hypothetical protein